MNCNLNIVYAVKKQYDLYLPIEEDSLEDIIFIYGGFCKQYIIMDPRFVLQKSSSGLKNVHFISISLKWPLNLQIIHQRYPSIFFITETDMIAYLHCI